MAQTQQDDPARAGEQRIQDSTAGLAAMSAFAARSFPTIEEAVDATLDLMQRLLGMEVRMVNQVDGDLHTFRYLQLPPDLPDLTGMVTPLNHNF